MAKENFIYCMYAIRRLRRFQNLIRHDQNWGYDVRFAKPLDRLLPRNTPKDSINEVIDQEINRMIPAVRIILHRVKVGTVIVSTKKEYGFDYKEIKTIEKDITEKYEMIEQYFDLPHDPKASSYRLLMQSIERGIGFYQDRGNKALFELINPFIWVVWLIRLPIAVLNRAGIEDKGVIMQIYSWVIRTIMVVMLIFYATKLGISIPWDEFLKTLLKYLR